MARIDTERRLLEVKLVYYGPALGGKTTNLQSLHSFLDPKKEVELMSLDTKGDRTLFFDLLPIELGEVQGFKLLLRLFTVPGQVHYNATRRIVLRDADGVAFVADSTPARLDANRESLRSLEQNLAADGVKTGSVPVVLQANKRDLPDAASIEQVEQRLGVEALQHHGRALLPGLMPASAVSGEGVFETFENLLRATLAAVHQKCALAKVGVTREKLGLSLYEALTPYRPTSAAAAADATGTSAAGRAEAAAQASAPNAPHEEDLAPNPWQTDPARAEDVLPIDALLEASVDQSINLAAALGDQRALRMDLQRRVEELEAINALAQGLVATVEHDEVLRAAVMAAAAGLPHGAASVLLEDENGQLEAPALHDLERDPLLHAGQPSLAAVLLRGGKPAHYADLDTELVFGDATLLYRLSPFCTLAIAPFDAPRGRKGLVVCYGKDPDRPAGPETTRYLAAVAAQANLALQNADRHALLVAHGEQLQEEVDARTEELRLAHEELMATSGLKDRILSCVNHELRTPVTKLLTAAQALERAKPGSTPPPSMLKNVAENARHLAGLLDQVLSAQALLSPGSSSTKGSQSGSTDLVKVLEAVTFAHQERAASRQVVLRFETQAESLPIQGDGGSVTLVLSQLVDNAVKFTGAGTEVVIGADRGPDGRVRVRVVDSGPGIPSGDVERIFGAFDQGGADMLVAKPNGLGLGLTIARRLARKLGGEVVVATAGEAPGATFQLELPAAPSLAATTR